MATTYTLISSNTLSSSQASVTFSAISSSYTDLVLKISARSTVSSGIAGIDVTLNGNTSSIYSYTRLYSDSTSWLGSNRSSSGAPLTVNYIDGSTATSNTFSNSEFYIPNYTGSTAKPMSWISMAENNSSTAYVINTATLANLTSAITTILLADNSGGNFAAGSSFWLYGIKNS